MPCRNIFSGRQSDISFWSSQKKKCHDYFSKENKKIIINSLSAVLAYSMLKIKLFFLK